MLTFSMLKQTPIKSNGKIRPTKCHEGPEGEQKYSYTTRTSATSVLEVGGKCHTPAALSPWKRPGTCCIGRWVGPWVGLEEYGIAVTGIRYPDGRKSSESLYRLSYLGPLSIKLSCDLNS
jgi:hypothetical protein